jgi:hypothetical protein
MNGLSIASSYQEAKRQEHSSHEDLLHNFIEDP